MSHQKNNIEIPIEYENRKSHSLLNSIDYEDKTIYLNSFVYIVSLFPINWAYRYF